MKIGDTVELLVQQRRFDEDPRGVVEVMEYGRVKVRFADGWRRFYSPGDLRVVEAVPEVAKGAGA